MSTTTETQSANLAGEMELVTFYVGGLLMGVDIHKVEEINRHITLTPVPHAFDYVRGVINLRGEVVTIVDLRTILDLDNGKQTECARNVVVNSNGEQIGLLIDRVADVIRAKPDEIEPPPANVSGVDGRFFKGLFKLENELLVILDVDVLLNTTGTDH